MTWLSVLGSVLYYLSLPFTTAFDLLLVALAPALHLGHYALSGLLFPLRLIAKFETLYIYLGVAAVIGILTGSILHTTSSVLVSIFKLTPTAEATGRSAASVRATREQKKLEQAWQSSTNKSEPASWKMGPSTEKNYAEWLETDRGQRGREQGLLRQTILEEDDDSEEGF